MRNKPNVIYILADDMGIGDVSALNDICPFTTTNLDELCHNGVAFCDAHSSSAVCTPSRYSILTGRYNWRSSMKWGVLDGYSRHLIEDNRNTVADLFKRNGYKTAAVGKWHLGMDFATNEFFDEDNDTIREFDHFNDGVIYDKAIKHSPISNGFDYYFGISASLDMPPYVYIENDRFTAKPDHIAHKAVHDKAWYRTGPTAKDFVHEETLDTLCDKVLDLIDENKDEPFFIYFPLNSPHGPILPAEKFAGKSGTNEYGDFVLHTDDIVGKVVNKLKELDIYEDTIVIFTADNGCSPIANYPELKTFGHDPSGGFRGHKADIYEGGHRIPYIIQWPNFMPKNKFCDQTVCLTDFFATMADIFGDEKADNEAEDSVSNLSLWKDPESSPVRKYTIHQSINGSLAIRFKNFKLEMCKDSGGWSYPVPNKDDTSGMPEFQLYDLNIDVAETTNIIEQYPELVQTLKSVLKQFIEDGRSTEGLKQKNNGVSIWKTISWIEDM